MEVIVTPKTEDEGDKYFSFDVPKVHDDDQFELDETTSSPSRADSDRVTEEEKSIKAE